ncbi:DUF1289 domain-containing protein [Ottowia sp. GY511]|uniref:DUF1289 domain-containing protein n=1 Tax=Ottowia flava TaxID=2675430 RepID=A0ABW4KT73_9BURK|nr:DUF1289 domain-containing protein [Ottowia sp. GY511]TXK30884.1 DUF1289 domain-containing protein [Ottowia sp. GY511]
MNREAACADGADPEGSLNPQSQDEIASPCTGVCRLHPATGWCEGCLRRTDEIARWGAMDTAARREVLARLAERRNAHPQARSGA